MGLLRRPIEVPRRLAKISLTIFATPCHASSLSTFPHVFPFGSLSGQLNKSLGLGELLFPKGVCLSGVSGEAYERALAIRIGGAAEHRAQESVIFRSGFKPAGSEETGITPLWSKAVTVNVVKLRRHGSTRLRVNRCF